MSTRPEPLYPLFSNLRSLSGVGPKLAALFPALNVHYPKDLLFTLPQSGIERRSVATVRDVATAEIICVEIEVMRHVPSRVKSRPYRVVVQDSELSFELVFFHARGDYLERILPVGARRIVSGKVEYFDNLVQIAHPDYILPVSEKETMKSFEPIYPLTAGVTQKTMQKAVRSALERVPDLPEWIDKAQKSQAQWPDWKNALALAHDPNSWSDLGTENRARQRLAYDEFFAHQMTLSLARLNLRRAKGHVNQGNNALRSKILEGLSFKPTGAQMRSVQDIEADMAAPHRMNRLLQGDVGSGKTLVAFLALLIAVESGGQGVLMAPTEILARQHMESLDALAVAAGVRLELLTGRDTGATRRVKLEALASGQVDILLGTHAVFQKDVEFADLRLAVVDEQHRFGVRQRLELGRKGGAVDVLVMTATPIPRSLALSHYGDMDVSILDEKPAGRKPITTAIVPSERLEHVIENLQKAVQDGRQAYWVCPLVEESEVLDYTSAEDRFKSLRAVLEEGVVELVHGQMPPAEKDAAMAKFERGECKVLVATTVIEVGVNVPNATIMIIERAEIFGLAQLHQLRGRVGRGEAASTCLLLYQAPLSKSGQRRLEIMRETEDGFKIAETDLEMRGAGDLIGTAQSGLPLFRIANVETMASLMAKAQSDARALLTRDPELTTERGRAVRTLLWLMEQEKAIRLISVG